MSDTPGAAGAATSRVVRVGDVVDAGRFAGLPLVVAIVTTLTLVFDGFDVQAVGFVGPALVADWGIERAALKPVMVAGLVGMLLGSLVLGPLGDRLGRRPMLLVSLVTVAIGSAASAFATGIDSLAIARLVTGIGLGGSIPSAAALIVEYAPPRLRNLTLSITVVGVPVGGVVGAEVAAHMLPAFGWPSVFIAGAVLPAALAAGAWLLLPESPRFLVARPDRHGELAAILNRLAPGGDFRAGDRFVFGERHAVANAGLAALFAAELRRDTVLLWIVWFTNVLTVYTFFSWLPLVLSGAGFPVEVALRGTLAFNLGGVVAAFLIAFALDRFGSRAVLPAWTACGALLLVVMAWVAGSVGTAVGLVPLLALMTALGGFVLGAQIGLYSLTAHVYPTTCRSSGLGSASAIGRSGGIVGAWAGGVALTIGDGVTPFFDGLAAVLFTTAVAMLLVRRQVPPARES